MPTPLAEGQENSFAPQMIFLGLLPGGWAKKIQRHLAPGALTHRTFQRPIGKDFERCFYPDNGGKGVVWCIEVSVRKVFAARYDNYTNQFLLPNKHFPIQCNLLLL